LLQVSNGVAETHAGNLHIADNGAPLVICRARWSK
jgi:hypothetical protein